MSSAGNSPTAPASTSSRLTEVFVAVRRLHSETELRTRILSKELAIPVPGSTWSCHYRAFDAQTVPDDPGVPSHTVRMHGLDCKAGIYSAGLSLECAVKSADLRTELGSTKRAARTLILVEQTTSGELRHFVTVQCEP